jgi:peptidoglycan/LPS O-acetylase OafA/YrhL
MVSSNKFLLREQSLIGQLICIMLVLIHHWSQKSDLTGIASIFVPFEYIGGCACCGFFFFSGYGLFESYNNNSVTFKRLFIRKRFVKVLVPFIFSCLIYYIIWIFREGQNFTFSIFIMSILGLNIKINGHFWFMQFLILLYISLYFSVLFVKEEKKQIILLIVANILLIVLLGRSCGYISSFGFCIGVMVSHFTKRCAIKLEKRTLLFTFFFFIICYYFAFYKNIFFKLTFTLSLFAFLPLLFWLSKKIKASKVLLWLAGYSYYFYLTNAMALIINAYAFGKNMNVLGLILYIVFNVFLGIVLKTIIDGFTKIISCYKISRK